MPLGILSLASCLREKGFNSEIYKPVFKLFNKVDFLNAANHILAKNPRFIGFSTWCNTFAASVLLAEQLKSHHPEVVIIFGGPQASIIPSEILKEFSFIDFVLCGEADQSLPELLLELDKEDKNLSCIPGLFFRNAKNDITGNQNSGFIPDLEVLPIPAYDMIPDTEVIKLDVGRGCPYQCTFCTTNSFFSKKYRTKSAKKIINEMEFVYGQTKITSFSFAHDMFTLNKKFILEFCTKLIEVSKAKKIHFRWTCSARIDSVSEELLTKMKTAGCHSIFFGIESGSNKIQENIKKRLKIDKVIQVADICRELNINMYASFIIGFPEETKGDIEKTLELILKLACRGSLIQISNLSVLPGTSLFSNFQKQLKFDGSFSNFSHSVVGRFELELIRKYPSFFSSFYYLPVKSMSRDSIVMLCWFINTMREFRNTLFLLEDEIKNDIENYYLLDIFLQIKTEIKRFLSANNPPVSLFKNLFTKYLKYKFNDNVPLQIKNVFLWEATQNLLKNNYTCWQIIKPDFKNSKPPFHPQKITNGNFTVSPVWQILHSTSDLSQLIPEKNNWKIKFDNISFGNHYYLIVARSDKFCNLYSIDSDEYELLNVLQKDLKENFLKQANNIYDAPKLNKWLFHLIEIGVLFNNTK